jgi:hypothetical protein
MTIWLCRYLGEWRLPRSPMLLISHLTITICSARGSQLVQNLRLVEQEINQGSPGTAGQPIKFDLEQEMIWGNNTPSTNQIQEPTFEAIQIISSFRISPEGPRIRRMICNGANTSGLTRGRSAIGVALIGARAARGWPIECHCRAFVGASCNALSCSSIAPRGVAMAMLLSKDIKTKDCPLYLVFSSDHSTAPAISSHLPLHPSQRPAKSPAQ